MTRIHEFASGFAAYLQVTQYEKSPANVDNVLPEYAPWADQAGFRVYIHDSNVGVYAESVSYAVGPGYQATIGLRYVSGNFLTFFAF